MAEAIVNANLGNAWQAYSAGTHQISGLPEKE
jgi:protein-tyrosine-phosphatase